MRTTDDGRITQALLDTLMDESKTPYISVRVGNSEFADRLLYLEHREEPYRDMVVIGLSNRDGIFDGRDLNGYEVVIGHGYDSSAHGGTATDTVTTPTLWVKACETVSVLGERVFQLFCEGMWMKLRETKVIPSITNWKSGVSVKVDQLIGPSTPNGHGYVCTVAGVTGDTEPSWSIQTNATITDGTAKWKEFGLVNPYSTTFNRTHTVYELMKLVIEAAMDWTLEDSPPDDGIIESYSPVFDVNVLPFENAAALLYRLIWMTKQYLRPLEDKAFKCIYPLSTDPIDETYYSWQEPVFLEYDEKTNMLIPNSIVVICNQDPSGEWNTAAYPLIVGTATLSDGEFGYDSYIRYGEVAELYYAGSIDNQEDADLRAEAILERLKTEQLAGRLILPFNDCRVELYDRIEVQDKRGR